METCNLCPFTMCYLCLFTEHLQKHAVEDMPFRFAE